MHYVLLPKLNREQQGVLAEHFAREGFKVERAASMTAKSPQCTFRVDAWGLCRSASDPSDYLLPVIPQILSCRKEAATLESLLGLYFDAFSRGTRTEVRLNSRLESLGNWDRLRSCGGSGLAPDEHMVARFLLDEAVATRGSCPMVTDFAAGQSEPFLAGPRLYFRTRMQVSRASETLRAVGMRYHGNSYLPRNGVLRLPKIAPGSRALRALVEELGDWCSFAAA